MSAEAPAVRVQVAGPGQSAALAELREQWLGDAAAPEPGFALRLERWLREEGERRTTWLAWSGEEAAGMASLFEYRRMPRPGSEQSRWGYVGNTFVRPQLRGRGIGAALLAAIVAAADGRGYARLMVSPSERSVPLYRRAGFGPADGSGGELLLVRPGAGRRVL